MKVAQATDGIPVKPNYVYVIPPNKHMTVSGQTLQLVPRPASLLALSVNCFLISLSEQRGKRAIAVILSGMANDGALGVKAIKSAGGIVFAQDELSAAVFSMPQSAAATGAVDYILPPEKIAAKLSSIARKRPL